MVNCLVSLIRLKFLLVITIFRLALSGSIIIFEENPKILRADSNISLVIRIAEVIPYGQNTGPVIFTIVKNSNLQLSFDSNETSRQNYVVENLLWTMTETSGLFIFTYNGDDTLGNFPSLSASRIGVFGTFVSPLNAKGTFSLDVIITGGSGEANLNNNKDSEVLEYNNL